MLVDELATRAARPRVERRSPRPPRAGRRRARPRGCRARRRAPPRCRPRASTAARCCSSTRDAVADQQPGGAEAAPVPMPGRAHDPAVAVTHAVSYRIADVAPATAGRGEVVDVGPPGRLSAEGRSWRQLWDRGPWIGPTPYVHVTRCSAAASRRRRARPRRRHACGLRRFGTVRPARAVVSWTECRTGAGHDARAPRPHRPALFADLTEMIDAAGGDASPSARAEIAAATAAVLVQAGREPDEATTARASSASPTASGSTRWPRCGATPTRSSLPGALWALYLLRQWCHTDADEVTRLWRAGEPLAPAEAVVAGVGRLRRHRGDPALRRRRRWPASTAATSPSPSNAPPRSSGSSPPGRQSLGRVRRGRRARPTSSPNATSARPRRCPWPPHAGAPAPCTDAAGTAAAHGRPLARSDRRPAPCTAAAAVHRPARSPPRRPGRAAGSAP